MRTVHPVAVGPLLKALSFDPVRLSLLPNLTFVDHRGEVAFETNEIGLKGATLDPARRLAVVWGDSVVFGSGRSWPCLLDQFAPGYQFLNGGILGDPYDNILRRAAALNRQRRVTLNLLMLGWHPTVMGKWRPASLWQRARSRFGAAGAEDRRLDDHMRSAIARRRSAFAAGIDRFQADLEVFLGEFANTVVLTMPTALNPSIVDRDLSACFHEDDPDPDDRFAFAGTVPYSVTVQREAWDHITARNAATRAVCERTGTRLVDLFAVLDTTGLPDFREDFVDILHLSPRAYAKAARAVYDAIADLL